MSRKGGEQRSGDAAKAQRPPAEQEHADELQRLAREDEGRPRPPGWRLTPQSVLAFVLGDPQRGLAAKFVGRRALIETCIVALATNRGLMLVGDPGTAKSWLSELLAAAISGDSTLTIQGSAGTTEDNIKYSWNYALLLAEGPGARSLVPGPLHRGMRLGRIVRFEEITRCPVEMQDTLLSVLSDRVLHVPEIDGEDRMLLSREGFNIIATANTQDRGVNEMSAALKRRFNFVTVPPIGDVAQEIALVVRETARALGSAGIPTRLKPEVAELLVTTFHELREGKSASGTTLEPMSTAMSTAEAVSVGVAAGVHAFYYDAGEITPEHLVRHLVGTAFKDAPEDLKRLRHYFNHVVKDRSGSSWKAYYEARAHLP